MTGLPYEYRDDIPQVDEAFRVWANDLDGLFRDAWEAVCAVLTEAPKEGPVDPELQRRLQLHDRELDLLLLRFLQEALFLKDAQRAIYRVGQIAVEQTADGWYLNARLCGCLFDHCGAGGSDVKAVTLDQLLVRQSGTLWEATVVLDL